MFILVYLSSQKHNEHFEENFIIIYILYDYHMFKVVYVVGESGVK